MARGMPWRRYQGDAPIAEYIGIAFDELKVFRCAQELTRQRHQLIDVVVRSIRRMNPLVLGLLHHNYGMAEQCHVAYMVSMRVRYCNTPNVAGFQPNLGELVAQ